MRLAQRGELKITERGGVKFWVFGSVWGNMDIYCWGLLGVDGCIQVFGGVGTWLLLFVFPLFAYHI